MINVKQCVSTNLRQENLKEFDKMYNLSDKTSENRDSTTHCHVKIACLLKCPWWACTNLKSGQISLTSKAPTLMKFHNNMAFLLITVTVFGHIQQRYTDI